MVVGLTGRQLEVLRMRYSGLRIEEIANKLNTSSANVSKILRQARRKISGINETILVLRTLGLAKDSADIELTDKGKELMKKWRRSRSILKRPSVIARVKSYERRPQDMDLKYGYLTDYFVKEHEKATPSHEVFVEKIEKPLRKIIHEEIDIIFRRARAQMRTESRMFPKKKKPSSIYT